MPRSVWANEHRHTQDSQVGSAFTADQFVAEFPERPPFAPGLESVWSCQNSQPLADFVRLA